VCDEIPPQFVDQQLTVQSTPALVESLPTRAESVTVCAAPEVCALRVEGVTAIVTGTGTVPLVICTVELTDFVVSVSDVPVMVTLPPAGTAEGAVYVVIAPITGLNEPQFVEPQVTDQYTPLLAGS
jgi:hypothetical protein